MSRALDGFQAYKYNKEKKAKRQGKSTEVTKIYDSDLPENQSQNTSPLEAFKRERGLGTLTDAGRTAYANRAVKTNPFDSMPNRSAGAQALWDLSQQGITQRNNATKPEDRFKALPATSLHQIGGLPGVVQQKRVEEYKATQAAPKGMGSFDDMAAAITADKQKREKAAKDALDMRPSYMKQQGQTPVRQDQLKTEDLMDAWYNGSNMEGSRNTAKSYDEYLKDLNTGKQSAQKFSEGVEKGKRDTRNELDLTDAEQAQAALGGGQRAGAQETTAMLSDDEKQNYYYLAGTQGKKDAENYRQYVIQNRGLNEQIAKRNQEAIAREMSYQTPIDRFLFESGAQFTLGAGGALENMSRVPAALTGDASYRAESTGQYLSQEMANAVDTSTLSGKAYKTWQQLMNTSGNNAVSIAGGVAFGPGAGSALFAAQAAGDAYQQVINQGGTVQQAQYFAAMQAIDEEVTNALLGGIAARGGGLLKDALGNTAVARSLQSAMKGMFVNNPVGLRIANGVLDALANGGSEALQEYTQYFSEKFEKWLATGEAPTFNVDGKEMTWDQIVEAKGSAAWDVFANPEALESALMGFLNAGLMNGIGSVGRTADAFQRGRNLSQDSYQTVLDMVDPNITHYRKEDTYRAGKEAAELARDQQRRVEAGQGNTLMSQYGRGLMAQAAQEYQRQYANNETAGRTYYNPDQVKALMAENERKNRALRRLAFGGETAIDKMNRVRSELAGDTAQAAWETPQNDYGVHEVTIPAEMHEQYTQDMLNRGSADRLEWEGDSGEMVSLQRENDGFYTFTNERGEEITLDPDEASDLLPSDQPITMYDNAGSTAVETEGASATPWAQNGTAAPTTVQTTAAAAQTTAPTTETTAPPTVSRLSPNSATSNGVAISQQGAGGVSGTDRLAQLADEAGKQTVEQREAQRNAIYEAGKNRDSDFQVIMDGATMLSEAEKTAAFNQGMQDSLNEVRMEGQNNGRTEEGNLVSGEGSGRNVPLRSGEQTSGLPQAAGGTAEVREGRGVLEQETGRAAGENGSGINTGRTGYANGGGRRFGREVTELLSTSADKDLRGITPDRLDVGEAIPARALLRTAVPGQVLYPVNGGNVYSMRKAAAMTNAYDPNIRVTPFISRGEIQVGGGESSRAFADPVRRQLGFRMNDEEATSIQEAKHELIEFGIMDGKINVDEAFNLMTSKVPERYVGDILYQYFDAQIKNVNFDKLSEKEAESIVAAAERHAKKEMICDIGAGIDQISGRIRDPKLKKLFEGVHKLANQALTPYMNERLNNAFKAEPAAETAESSVEGVELTKEAMTDGVASDGITMEGEDSIQLSEKLYKESGRDFLRNWLAEQEDISQEDKDDIVAQVDHIYDIMQQIKEEASEEGIAGYRAWADVAERNGRLTVITPNGEYPLNIDFATVCKKRKALDFVLNTMITDGDLDAQKLAGADIVRLQNLIKDEGFEIACALCFVDSKRYRIGKWADGIVNGEVKKDGKKYGYNELVRSLVPEGSKLKIDQFNYTGRDVKQPRGRLLKNASDSQLDFTLIDKVIAENKPGSWNRNLATAIKENPELRSLLNSAELLSSVGFDPIKVKNPALFDIINNAGGSSKPKLSFSEVPYLNDILMSDAMTPEAAYSVGGVRIQSFSDFMANMVFDYVQMVSELQAKKLPAHAYTKEAAFVAMFGKTGIKINMSLVPKATTWSKAKLDAYLKTFKTKKERDKALAKLKNMAGLDAQGNYIWEDESFPYAVAMKFQADPEYAKNCGTIAVGVSDRHIKKLLMDPTIQMVIPYHKSGINPVVAKLRGIDLYNDYTNQQNTRYKKSGRKISAKANTFDFYGTLQETGDPRATAEAYLAWCKENDFIPKFQKFAKDPETRPYYYKLLADFRLYDDTGAYAPQGAVKGNYPDNMKDLILNGYSYTDENGTEYHNGGLLDAQKVSDALREKTREIINRYNSGEGKVQNSSKLGSEEIDISSTTDSDEDSLQTKINSSMTMDQAKQMVQRAFNIGDIKAWFDGEYKNGDEWLAGEGSRAVALVIDNDYSLQQKYINKVQGILDDEFTIEDVLDAYSNQSLTGAVKEKKSYDVDLSKSAGYKDNRFYAPKAPAVTAETLNTANMRATAANKEQVNKARLDILIAAHNDANIADKLGITKPELNKKLRTWSRYSARAMSLAEKLNNGVALENQWSGLQNCSIISQMNVTDDDINSMVKSITGTSRGNERNYIAKTILAADTHIDWSWLNFEFKEGRAVEDSANVRGLFGNDNIIIGGNGYMNTVAHEMGHALSSKWASDLMGTEPGHGVDLADHLYNESYIKDPDAKRFAKHFEAFMDSLTDVNDIRSEYTNRPGEVFARFFAKFVEWTNKTAGNYFFSESEYYKDQFKPSQYTEFVKLLQEKAALDAKQAVAEETSTPDIEAAADDPNNTNVIRMGSEQDIQYSSKFKSGIDDKLRVRMGTFFAGTGTVDFALRNIVSHQFAVEYDAKIAALYRANNNGGTVYADDVRDVNIDPYKGKVEYFHASPVCKNYSGAKNNAEELPLDLETAQATADAINTLQPKVVTVENVARYRNSEAIKIIEDALRKNGYTFDKGVYRASDFGGATIRERMFLRAVKDGTLPKIDTSEYTPMSWYDAVQDLIPKLPKVSMPNFMAERLEPSGIDIDNLKQPIFILGGNKGRTLSYAEADKPAPTILANSHDARIVMPDGRILKATPRVMARIQGLPDAFDLKDGKGGMTNAYRVVGNGVPVQLTQGIVGPLLEENLIKQKSEATGIQYSSKLDSAGNKLTEAQAEYFKDSKVVDEDGNLKVVYHGTPRGDFTVFDESKIGTSTDYGWYGRGFYFTDRESSAKYYAGYLNSSRVMKGYLNITNPYNFNIPKGESKWRWMADIMGEMRDTAEEQAEAFTEYLKSEGYDGLIADGQYMIFDSNQFKNIDNQNPTKDADIRYSSKLPIGQEATSADTSRNQVAALFKAKNVHFGETNIDIGGGKWDLTTNYLAEKGTRNMIFDPFNRSEENNTDVLNYLRDGNRADTATCANVLNVISSEEARANVILEVAKSIKPDGTAYFSTYEGNRSGVGKRTRDGWQENRKTEDYVDEIKKYFEDVKSPRNGVIEARKPKENLPKAVWEVTPGKAVEYSSSLSKEDYAPTFYSKLQREIQNFKGEKIGTASVESYLKGKGVKDEEIKWSGIRTFLEGKKSVNKAELMDYLKANEMEIEQTVLDDNPVFIGPDVDGKERTFRSIEEIQKLYADKYGEDVLRNEDYDDYMERYSFSIGDEDYSFSKENSGDNETHWEGYRLDGGENYREILFRIPGSNYSNNAMSTHWNESGVLAHARVQDFEAEDGGKVLFVEEIQSDWHNAGQKKGYYDLRSINKLREEKIKTEAAFNEHGVTAMQELTDYLKKIGYDRGAKAAAYDFAGSKAALDDMKADGEYSKELINAVEKAQKYYLPYKQANDAYNDAYQDYYKTNVPDAPFRTTYTDFVLKNLLRMAAEGDYDYLAWTTGKMQEERWSNQYAEGYRIEYDQQIPKFLKKYGKQWGANLTEIGLWTSNDSPQEVDSKIREFVEAIKEYDKDATYESVRSEMPGLVGYAVSWMEEDDPNWDRITGLAKEIENAEFMNSNSTSRAPAIVVNDAMKESVLTEGQPMYSSKNTGEIDETALDPRRVFISYNPDLQNAVREISDVLTAYQELAPTQAEIKRTTRQIAKKFGSHINVDLAARKMETLYNFLAGGGKPDGREVLEISMDIANDILDEATHNDPEIEKRWKNFKAEMRKRRIYIPKDRVHDLNPDGIKALRRQWKGKMLFTTDEKYRERYGQIHYQELQQMFPEYFTKNADNMNDIEAIEEIMYAFEAQAPIYEQIYAGATRDEAALEIAYDIMQGYFGNDRAKDRFKKIYRDYVKPIKDRAIDEYRDKLRSIELKDAAAVEQRSVFDQIKGMKGSYVVNEKALKDVDYQGRQAMMERLREKAEQDKKRYEEQIEKVKAGYVERSQKDRLMRLAKELRTMKGGPEFEQKKKELIGDLDLIAKGISYNYERKLMDMKDEYEKLAEEDPNFEPDRATIKKIERLQKKQINQMTSYEITALTEAILKMKQDQWTHNRMIRETDAALIADEGRQIVNETNALKGTKGMNRLADAIDGYSLAHLNSKRAFRKMSGYNDKSGLMKLWNELNEGQHKTMDFRRRAVSPFDAFMSEEENKDFITGMFDPTVEITSSKIEFEDENGNVVRSVEPKTVKITPAMKISIYLHSLNQDNREHAKYGGFRIPNMDKYERGDYSNAYGQGSTRIQLTKADMQNIASTMTPQELRFADLAHEYFNKTSKEAINEASMLLNGYELASVDNYMPIKTDPNFTKKDMSGLMQDGTIEGQGWTKDRNFMAKNPILLEDITQVLQRSIDGAALYYGLAIPIRNFNKVYNFQRSGYTDSVKEAIMQTFGKRGNEYIEKLLRDLQGGSMDTKDAAGKWVDRFTSGLRGNYAQAILTLNPSVAIKQAASYPTAAARLGFEPLKKALAKLTTSTKEDMDLINKYTPLLWYRAQGQSSDALAEVSKRKDAWQYKGGVEKTRQIFNWIQNIDVKTVKTLWYASEYYVQDNMPGLKEGTEAYYREVAKVFNEVVEDTQPNYTTMQRASISRVDNEIMKAVFMFKTQPLQNVGILYDSIMEYQAKQEAFKQAVKNGFEGDALNEYAADMAFARQGMMRSVASITVSTLVFSAMTQLAKLLLHRVDPLRDEETGELTKASILKNFFGNAAESLAGMLAGAGEIYSLIMAMTTGSYLDNLSVSGIDSLNDTMTKMLKTYQNIGKILEDEETSTREKVAASIVASRDLAIQIMDLTGIPANNAKKIAEALVNHYNDVINPIFTGRSVDLNLESGARITDKQYANRALKYYQKGNIVKGDAAAAKIEKASAMQSALGAKGKKDEDGNSIANSKKYDAIHRILRTPGPEEAKGKMFAAAYPSDELSRYMYGGGSAYDFMQGQMLAEEIADLSEDERRKKLYSFVEETGYTLEQKKAWLVSDKDRIESKTLTAWRDANGTDWDYIKHMSNLEKFNGSKEKKKKVVAYIKRQTTDMKKRKALFLMAGYQLDSKEDGKTVKDGNFKKAMEN